MERKSLNRRGFFEFLTPTENNAHIYSAVMYEQSWQLPEKAVHGHVLVTNLKMGTLSEEGIHVRPPQKKSTNFVENEINTPAESAFVAVQWYFYLYAIICNVSNV